jgi:LPPG:FO 2-phospho-L-lactate transferase
MTANHYLAITGGTGGAKLALGLAQLLGEDELAFVVNTSDDFEHLGLHISPDIDTLVYTLAEQNNLETGWGRRNESWHCMSALAELGGETWFKLGDKDLAMNIERSRRLRDGAPLSKVTASLAKSLGVRHVVLPMSDDPVRTRVRTENGSMDFQHYFVREGCKPAVTGFDFLGAASAQLNPDIHKWLNSEYLAGVILCPSNPFISIDPALSLPGLREMLQNRDVPVIAVSPIVGGDAVKGPLAKMMREMSIPTKASWIAEYYCDFLDGLVIDLADDALIPDVEALGVSCTSTSTVMTSLDDCAQLAKCSLEFIANLSESKCSTANTRN